MPQKDPKVIAIWILSIALVIVSILLIVEVNKPDSIEDITQELTTKRQGIQEVCADTATDDKRETCMEALRELEALIEEIK